MAYVIFCVLGASRPPTMVHITLFPEASRPDSGGADDGAQALYGRSECEGFGDAAVPVWEFDYHLEIQPQGGTLELLVYNESGGTAVDEFLGIAAL